MATLQVATSYDDINYQGNISLAYFFPLFHTDVAWMQLNFIVSVLKTSSQFVFASLRIKATKNFSVKNFNPLKCSGVRQLHLKVFNAIQV